MKIKNVLIVVLVLIASSMSLFFTGCKGKYDDVWVSVESASITDGTLTLDYVYDEQSNTYSCATSNEVFVKIHGLDKKMLSSLSYSQTNSNLLQVVAEKTSRAGEYKVAIKPFVDGVGNIIKGGKSKITFISDAGNKQASLNVVVNINLNEIRPAQNAAALFALKGGEVELASSFVQFVPENSTYKGVEYAVYADDEDDAEIIKRNGKQYLKLASNFEGNEITGLNGKYITIKAYCTQDETKSCDINLVVLPNLADLYINETIDSLSEDVSNVILYSAQNGQSKTFYINGEISNFAHKVEYKTSNNNVVRVVNLTGDGHAFDSFSLEYNQEGSARVSVIITLLEYNYTITKYIDVNCVLLPDTILTLRDDSVLENNKEYALYDKYNNASGSEFVVDLTPSAVLANNKKFVVLFNAIGGGKVTDIINITTSLNYIDATNLCGNNLDAFAKTLTINDVKAKTMANLSSFYLKAKEIGKKVEMLIVPYAYIEAGSSVLNNAPMFKTTLKTTIGADEVRVQEIENLASNIYYIELGKTESLSFVLSAVRNNKVVVPSVNSAKIVFENADYEKFVEVEEYNVLASPTNQCVKITANQLTDSPISVRLALDNGVLSDPFNIYVYSTLNENDVKISATTNLNSNSYLGSIEYVNNDLKSVDISRYGTLSLKFNYTEDYTIKNVSYDLRQSNGLYLKYNELVMSGSTLVAKSPIKKASVTILFTTYEFVSYGKVQEKVVSKTFVITVFEPIENLIVQKQNAVSKEYENVNSINLYYSDDHDSKNPTEFKVMDYYSYNVYGLANANIRVNFNNIENQELFGNVKYKWSISAISKNNNGETLKLTNSELRECSLKAFRYSNTNGASDNEIVLTCSITQYNKIYTVSVVVVLREMEKTTNLNILNNNIYLEDGKTALQSVDSTYNIYKQSATNKNLDYLLLSGSECVDVNVNSQKINFTAKEGGVATFVFFATDSTLPTKTGTKQIWKNNAPSTDVLLVATQNKTPEQIEEYLKDLLTDGLIYKVVKVKVADGKSEQTAYEIATKTDFNKIENNGYDKWYVVVKDIDLGEFSPIGNNANVFKEGGLSGNYNGRNSTLKFSQTLSSDNNYGLFYKTEYAIVKDINLVYEINGSKTLNGNLFVGAITGNAEQCYLNAFSNINITISGEINLTFNGESAAYIGGAVGVNKYIKTNNNSLTNVSVESALIVNTFGEYSKTEDVINNVQTGTDPTTGNPIYDPQVVETNYYYSSLYVGGVVGVNKAGYIQGSYSNLTNKNNYTYVTGTITINNTETETFNENNIGIGGVVGLNKSDTFYNGVFVKGYYVDAKINAQKIHNVGGIVGYNCGAVIDTLFAGTIEGANNVGGVVGLAETSIQAQHATNLRLEYNVVEILKIHGKDNIIKGAENVGGLIGKIGYKNITWLDNDKYDSISSVGYTITACYVKAYSNNLQIVGSKNVAGLVGLAYDSDTSITSTTITDPDTTSNTKTLTFASIANVCSASVKVLTGTNTYSQSFFNGTLTCTNCYNNTKKDDGTGAEIEYNKSGATGTGIAIDTDYKLSDSDALNYSDKVVLVYNGFILGKISPREIIAKFNTIDLPENVKIEKLEKVDPIDTNKILATAYYIKIHSKISDLQFVINLEDILNITNGANSINFTDLMFETTSANAKIVVNNLYIYGEGEIVISVTSKYSDASSQVSINSIYDLQKYEIVDNAQTYKADITINGETGSLISISLKKKGSITLIEKINNEYKLPENFKIKVGLTNVGGSNITTVYFSLNGKDIKNSENLIERSLNYILKLKNDKPTETLYMSYYAYIDDDTTSKEVKLSETAYIELIVYQGAEKVEVDDADEIRINATSTSMINVDITTDNTTDQEVKIEVEVEKDGVKTPATFNTGTETEFTATVSGGNFEVKYNGIAAFKVNYTVLNIDAGVRFVFTITPNSNIKDELLTAAFKFTADDYSDIVKVVSEPVEVTNISINNYTSFQNSSITDNEYEFNLNESTSNELAPGEFGLIIADVYPFSAKYDEIQIEYETTAGASLSFVQLVQNIDNSSTGNVSLNTTYKILNPTATVLPNGKGLILNKLSTVDNGGIYDFDGKLYIGVICNSSARVDQFVKIKVSTIRFGSDGEAEFTKVSTKQLIVKAQAMIDMDVENKVQITEQNIPYILAPVGTTLSVNITVENSTAIPEMAIGYLDTFAPYADLPYAYKPMLDQFTSLGNGKFVQTIDVSFLSDVGKKFYILANITEIVDGNYREYTKALYFITTEFTVSGVYVDGFDVNHNSFDTENNQFVASGEIKVLQNLRNQLIAKVRTARGGLNANNKLYSNMIADLSNYNALINAGIFDVSLESVYNLTVKTVNYIEQRYNQISKSIENFEMEISNVNTPEINEFDHGKSRWDAIDATNDKEVNITIGKTIGKIKFGSSVARNDISVYDFIGLENVTGVSVVLNLVYGFLNGVPSVYAAVDNSFVGNRATFSGSITVISSNTQETPTPVFTKEDLYNMQGKTNEHFILMNDLDLTSGFTPLVGDFASFDGNGHTIKITNLAIREDDKNNLGFFTEIREDTVVKNLFVMYMNSNLKSYTMKVDLSKQENSVNFGLFAGKNSGVINNCMVVPYVNEGSIQTVNIDIKSYNTTAVNFGGFVGENAGEILYSNISNNEIIYETNNTSENGAFYLIVLSNGSTEVVSHRDLQGYKNDNVSFIQLKQFTQNFLEEVRSFESDTPSFNVIGQGNLASFVYNNVSGGTIVSSYAKNVGLYNLATSISGSRTAGFACINRGAIYESYVEGSIDIYNDSKPKTSESLAMSLTTQSGKKVNIYVLPYIYSQTNIAGFVFDNTNTVENCFASINLFTNARSAGFVFSNGGNIKNCYTNSVNSDEENSSAHTYFTGTNSLNVVQNTGKIEYCYYVSTKALIVDTQEYIDPASRIDISQASEYGNFDMAEGEYNPLNQQLPSSQESVWVFESLGTLASSGGGNSEGRGRPILVSTKYQSIPKKQLEKFNYVSGVITTYYFDDKNIGKFTQKKSDESSADSKTISIASSNANPLLVSNAEEFLNAIFETGSLNLPAQFSVKNSLDTADKNLNILSYTTNVESMSEYYYNGYIRLIDDIDLDIELDMTTDPLYTQKRAMLSKIIFAGKLDGAYHTISGLTLTSSQEGDVVNTISNYAFGMFAQVGVSKNVEVLLKDGKSTYVGKANPDNIKDTIIKNLSLEIDAEEGQQVGTTAARSVGTLAGEAVNSTLLNISVIGNGACLVGNNYVGGLVGRLSEECRVDAITVSNLSVASSMINKPATVNQGYNYSGWSLNEESASDKATLYTSKYIFDVDPLTLKGDIKQLLNKHFAEKETGVKTGVKTSYAGGVFGVVDIAAAGKTDDHNINNHFIKNVEFNGSGVISAELAGGIAGFLGEGNFANNLRFVMAQDNSQHIAGLFASGGLVAENHGEIQKSTVEIVKEITVKIEEDGFSEDEEVITYPKTLFKPVVQNGKNSYSKFIGGIAAINYGIVKMAYNKAPIVNEYATYVGGIAGVNILTTYKAVKVSTEPTKTSLGATLEQVYTMGNVQANSQGFAGGVVGLYIVKGTTVHDFDTGANKETEGKTFTDNIKSVVALNMFEGVYTNLGAVYGEIQISNVGTLLTGASTYYNKFNYADKNRTLEFAKQVKLVDSTPVEEIEVEDIIVKNESDIKVLEFLTDLSDVDTFEIDSGTDATETNLIDICKKDAKTKFNTVFAEFGVENWDKENYLYPRLVLNAATVYQEIKTESDLENIDANGRYVLANDIYLSKEWSPKEFNGILTSKFNQTAGKYYSIYNVNIGQEGLKNSYSNYVGFFSTTTNANIVNITLHIGGNKQLPASTTSFEEELKDPISNWFDRTSSPAELKTYNTTHYALGYNVGISSIVHDDYVLGVGGLIGKATKTYISNCKVEFEQNIVFDENNDGDYDDPNDINQQPASITVGKTNINHVGGFIAWAEENSGILNNTINNAYIKLTSDEGKSEYETETHIGGFIGESKNNRGENNNSVKDIKIEVATTDASLKYCETLNLGGAYGKFEKLESNKFSIKVENVIITNNASGIIYNSDTTNIGGFIGKPESSINDVNIKNISINLGDIKASSANIGGFVGFVETLAENKTIEGCSVYGVDIITADKTVNTENNIGGFIGKTSGKEVLITACGVYGIINLTDSVDDSNQTFNVGGFVGFNNQSTIEKSFSNVSINENILNTKNSKVYIGGFVGYSCGVAQKYAYIQYCYSVGSAIILSGKVANIAVGGFLGIVDNCSNIKYNYTLTSIYESAYYKNFLTGTTTTQNIGGFYGANLDSSINNYSTDCYYVHNLSLVSHNGKGKAVARQELNTLLLGSTYNTNGTTYYPYIDVDNKDVLKCLGYSAAGGFITGTRFNPIQVDDQDNFLTDESAPKETNSKFLADQIFAGMYKEYVLINDITLNDKLTINGFVNSNGFTVNMAGKTIIVQEKNTIKINELELKIDPTFTGGVVNMQGTANTAFTTNSGTIFNTLVSSFDTNGQTFVKPCNGYNTYISGFININNGTIINSGTNAKFDLVVELQQTQAVAGFVVANGGTVYNCYTTAEFKNIKAELGNQVSGFVIVNEYDGHFGNVVNCYTAMLYVCNRTAAPGLVNYFAPVAAGDTEPKGKFVNCFADINSIPYARLDAYEKRFVSESDKTTNSDASVKVGKTEYLQTELALGDAWLTNTAFNYGYPVLKDYATNADSLEEVVILTTSYSNNIKLMGSPDAYNYDNALYTGNGSDSSNAYHITHPGMLSALDNDTNYKISKNDGSNYFKLMYDLDFYTYTTAAGKTSNGWKTVDFIGYTVFIDAQSYQLLKLQFAESSTDVGLFKSNTDSRGTVDISNLVVNDPTFTTTFFKDGGVIVSSSVKSTFTNIIINIVEPMDTRTIYGDNFGGLIGSCGTLETTNCFVNIEGYLQFTNFGFIAGKTNKASIILTTTIGDIKLRLRTSPEKFDFGGLVGVANGLTEIANSATLGNIDISEFKNITTAQLVYAGGFVGNQAGGQLVLTNSYTVLTIDNIDYTNPNILAGGFVGQGEINNNSTGCYYDSSYTKTITFKGLSDVGVGDNYVDSIVKNTNGDDVNTSDWGTNSIGSAVYLKSHNIGSDWNFMESGNTLAGQFPIQKWTSSYATSITNIIKPYVDYDVSTPADDIGAKLNPVLIYNDTSKFDIGDYWNQINSGTVLIHGDYYALLIEDINFNTLKTHDALDISFDDIDIYLMGAGKTISYAGAYPFDTFSGYMSNVSFYRESEGGNDFAGIANDLISATLFKVDVKIIESHDNFNEVHNFGGFALNANSSNIIDCSSFAKKIIPATATEDEKEVDGCITLGLNYRYSDTVYNSSDKTTINAAGFVNYANVINFAHSTNKLNICATTPEVYIGGFIAKSEANKNAKFAHCTNEGKISTIFLKITKNYYNTFSDNPIESKHVVAGYIACSENLLLKITNCLNKGSIDNRATQVAYAGGFVGLLNITSNYPIINNCENQGDVSIASNFDYIRLTEEEYNNTKTPTFAHGFASFGGSELLAGGLIGKLKTIINLSENSNGDTNFDDDYSLNLLNSENNVKVAVYEYDVLVMYYAGGGNGDSYNVKYNSSLSPVTGVVDDKDAFAKDWIQFSDFLRKGSEQINIYSGINAPVDIYGYISSEGSGRYLYKAKCYLDGLIKTNETATLTYDVVFDFSWKDITKTLTKHTITYNEKTYNVWLDEDGYNYLYIKIGSFYDSLARQLGAIGKTRFFAAFNSRLKTRYTRTLTIDEALNIYENMRIGVVSHQTTGGAVYVDHYYWSLFNSVGFDHKPISAGGAIGYIDAIGIDITLSKFTNKGNIIAEGAYTSNHYDSSKPKGKQYFGIYAGGVVGCAESNFSKFSYCTNNGNITSSVGATGIVWLKTSTFEFGTLDGVCKNTGAVLSWVTVEKEKIYQFKVSNVAVSKIDWELAGSFDKGSLLIEDNSAEIKIVRKDTAYQKLSVQHNELIIFSIDIKDGATVLTNTKVKEEITYSDVKSSGSYNDRNGKEVRVYKEVDNDGNPVSEPHFYIETTYVYDEYTSSNGNHASTNNSYEIKIILYIFEISKDYKVILN